MKAVCLLFLVLVPALALAFSDEEYQHLWQAWKREHGKQYAADEHDQRFAVFKSNLDFIQSHNEEFERGVHSFWVGMNQFGDLTNEEFRAMLGTRVTPQHSPRAMTYEQWMDMTHERQDVPDSWDWRDHGAVLPSPKNQGQCGSCWAFSAVAALEGANFLATKKLIALSEQLCVDCANGGKDTCDRGGEMQECFEEVIRRGGEETENDYPYTAQSKGVCHFDGSKVAAKFSSYVNVTSGDEQALKTAAASHVIAVAIDASHLSFQFYMGGVYDEKKCKSAVSDLDHGVAVVGYGSYSGKDMWIVRNSWGNWGLKGYIMMSRNKGNQCGIATDGSFVIAQ